MIIFNLFQNNMQYLIQYSFSATKLRVIKNNIKQGMFLFVTWITLAI